MSLSTEYVLEDGKAVLRYIPGERDEYYVDAKTGKLVNLTRMYEFFEGDTYDSATTGVESIPHVELEDVSSTEGALPLNALDKEMRAISPLGLLKYKLASSSYAQNPEAGEV